MADQMRIGLEELLRKARVEEDAGFLREGVRVLCQALMEMEVEQHVGPARYERTPERSGYRATATAQRLPAQGLRHEGRDRGARGSPG